MIPRARTGQFYERCDFVAVQWTDGYVRSGR